MFYRHWQINIFFPELAEIKLLQLKKKKKVKIT